MNELNHFSDLSEIKHQEMGGFKEIQPENGQTMENAKGFWDDAFSKTEVITDISELSDEIVTSLLYDASESDFQFDFEFDPEIRDVMEAFAPEEWANMSEKERLDTANELAGMIGERLGVKNQPPVYFINDDPSRYGGYHPTTNDIRINRLYLDDAAEMLDTIAHEMRHAYQQEHAANPVTLLDQFYALNMQNYISPGMSRDLYFSQLVEAEARAFASLFKNPEV